MHEPQERLRFVRHHSVGNEGGGGGGGGKLADKELCVKVVGPTQRMPEDGSAAPLPPWRLLLSKPPPPPPLPSSSTPPAWSLADVMVMGGTDVACAPTPMIRQEIMMYTNILTNFVIGTWRAKTTLCVG